MGMKSKRARPSASIDTRAAVEASASGGGERRRAERRFLVVFLVVAGGLSLAYFFPWPAGGPVDVASSAYLHVYAKAAGLAISLFDPRARVFGQEIVGGFALRIVRDCDAMEANILYGAAVVAFSASWKQRGLGLGLGLLAIGVANVLRIVSLYLIGARWPSVFDTAHREIAPLAIVSVALFAFILWTSWTTGGTTRGAASTSHAAR
jgi:exosortase/archaeosortase family protein